MLAALLLLGILPFAAMPSFQGAEADSGASEEDNLETPSEPVDETTISLTDEEDAGVIYVIEASTGTTVVEDFQPGLDSVEMDLTAVPGDVYFETAIDDASVVLSVTAGDTSVATVAFKGLSDVPVGDIFVRVIDEATGDVFEVPLSDTGAEMPEDVIDPTNPDLPDAPGPEVSGETVTMPSDPEDLDPEGPSEIDPETVLDPIDPDADLAASDSGVSEASKGEFKDSPVEVANFRVGQDFLTITLDPYGPETDAPLIEVNPSEDGRDGLVVVNGDLVAILKGAPEATTADVHVEVQTEAAA